MLGQRRVRSTTISIIDDGDDSYTGTEYSDSDVETNDDAFIYNDESGDESGDEMTSSDDEDVIVPRRQRASKPTVHNRVVPAVKATPVKRVTVPVPRATVAQPVKSRAPKLLVVTPQSGATVPSHKPALTRITTTPKLVTVNPKINIPELKPMPTGISTKQELEKIVNTMRTDVIPVGQAFDEGFLWLGFYGPW